eukprot:c21524_g3_i1.p1 GENE.c21524_g3_i1~~c21524_g3_i1.p1  ORF type:complete len:715 (-),score=269.08 c21524_g3_i1:94-2238(-)
MAIQQLFTKLKEIKAKSEQSEAMVQEICQDIKSLDYGKRHLTSTITILKRLHMLVTAIDQLKHMTKERQYRDAANILEAAKQLSQQFHDFRRVQKISDLLDQVALIENDIRLQIMEDFKKGIHLPQDRSEGSLAEACRLVDALGLHVRQELLIWYSSVLFANYRTLFKPTGDRASLDKIHLRYEWMRKCLQQYDQDHSNIFPSNWLVDEQLCIDFIEVTSKQISEILESNKTQLDVSLFMQVLKTTVEFEKELQRRFSPDDADGAEDEKTGGDSHNNTTNASSTTDIKAAASATGEPPAKIFGTEEVDMTSVEGIKLKYLQAQKKKADQQSAQGQNKQAHRNYSRVPRKWNGISESFEPYMDLYVRQEDKNMQDFFVTLIEQETWTISESAHTKVLQSSSNLFLYIKKILKRSRSYTRGQKLVALHGVFKNGLVKYANQLDAHLPAVNAPLQPDNLDEQHRICYIINTAEYCYETCQSLCESIQKLVSAELAAQITVVTEQDAFHGVSTKGVKCLIARVFSVLENPLTKMTAINWQAIKEVGDSSEYVSQIGSELAKAIPPMASTLNATYLRFFCDKFVSAFVQRFIVNIYKCRRVSETGAQQLLLDTQTLQSILVKLPIIGFTGDNPPPPPPASYKKYVEKEMDKAEALLKVVGTPIDGVLSTFLTVVSGGTNFEFQKILELKGLKKVEITQLTTQLSASRTMSSTNSTIFHA